MNFYLELDGKIYAPAQSGWVACNIINGEIIELKDKVKTIGKHNVLTYWELCMKYGLNENNYIFPGTEQVVEVVEETTDK